MGKRDPSLRVTLLPRDTNEAGTIFGGVILSHIDLAGGIEAAKLGNRRFVTVAMKAVEFKKPVYMGDIVSFYTQTIRIGRTSVTVHVDVEARRRSDPNHAVKVTEADVVYVAIDEMWRPVPIRS